jgi:hypothetical protein
VLDCQRAPASGTCSSLNSGLTRRTSLRSTAASAATETETVSSLIKLTVVTLSVVVYSTAAAAAGSALRGGSASPLKWLLNGSSRATSGLGVPLNKPDRDHDKRTRGHRFSRVPQRGHRRPPVGPDIMATRPPRPRTCSAEATARDGGGHRRSFNGHR